MSLVGLIAAVLGTATISGIFGMGGGMILMGIYVMALPVASAMLLHGITQLGSNGFRAFLFRRHVRWRIALQVGLGGGAALALFTGLQLAASRAVVFVVLGAVPMIVLLVPRRRLALSIERPPQAVLCGALFVGVQLVAGASGPILDAFFLRGSLERHQIIGTKAVIGASGHIAKLAYWGLLLDAGGTGHLSFGLCAVAVGCAVVGTRLGKAILSRISELQFRRGSSALVLAISGFYLIRGVIEMTN